MNITFNARFISTDWTFCSARNDNLMYPIVQRSLGFLAK